MADLFLGKEDVRVLEVHVPTPKGKERVYKLPLAGSLDLGDSMAMMRAYNAPKRKRDRAFFLWFYDFACRHISKQVIDSLSQDQFGKLAQKWQEESDRADETEASLGE